MRGEGGASRRGPLVVGASRPWVEWVVGALAAVEMAAAHGPVLVLTPDDVLRTADTTHAVRGRAVAIVDADDDQAAALVAALAFRVPAEAPAVVAVSRSRHDRAEAILVAGADAYVVADRADQLPHLLARAIAAVVEEQHSS